MGMFSRLLGLNAIERRQAPAMGDWELIIQSLRQGDVGVVTPGSSMKIAAVFACVRVLSESLAQLPLRLMEEDGRMRQPAKQHPLYRILNFLPNPEMTSTEFRLTLMGHLALWGNAYAQIVFDGAGRRRELWPLRPDRMSVERSRSGEKVYLYQTERGTVDFDKSEIMHLHSASFDGMTGLSPVATVRRTFELKAQMDEYGAAFWENDARPGMVLKHAKVLSAKARENILGSWEERHKGPSKSGRPAILEEGMDIATIGLPQSDAQFLETQKFTRSEIAAIFRVPAHMIGDLEHATFSNIEEQATEFVTFTLEPWIKIWQDAIRRDLLWPHEQDRYYAHFTVQALLKGKHSERAQFYHTLHQVGAVSPNDIREWEDLNPIDGGDLYMVPMNMQPVGDAGAASAAASEDVRLRIAPTVIAPVIADAVFRLRRRVENDLAQRGAKARKKGDEAYAGWLVEYRSELANAAYSTLAALGVTLGAADGLVSATADEYAERVCAENEHEQGQAHEWLRGRIEAWNGD